MQLSYTADDYWKRLIEQVTGCKNPQKIETVQSLWSGFGSVFRVKADNTQLIVKHVVPPNGDANHPRGWSSDFATARKLQSYEAEIHWYKHHSHQCDNTCRVPMFHGALSDDKQSVLILEDLDQAGYPDRYSDLSVDGVLMCVDWLASFHARFIDSDTDGMWTAGTYWHLATRPDEFKAMEAGRLKDKAGKIDRILNTCRHQTLVHGDAKVANFCFAGHNDVAAVDFQYVGGGCGMKDLTYFIGSCLDENECEAYSDDLLNRYFTTFATALGDDIRADQIEAEWRTLFPMAWTDFYRFLSGWMPSHTKIHRYTRLMAEQTFDSLPSFPDIPPPD